MSKNNFLQKVSEEVYRNSKKAGNIVPINEKGITYGDVYKRQTCTCNGNIKWCR